MMAHLLCPARLVLGCETFQLFFDLSSQTDNLPLKEVIVIWEHQVHDSKNFTESLLF